MNILTVARKLIKIVDKELEKNNYSNDELWELRKELNTIFDKLVVKKMNELEELTK